MKRVLIRFSVSLAIVFAATSLYFPDGSMRSAAAAPWLWAFDLEGRFVAREILPTVPAFWFACTAGLLLLAAARRLPCYIATGWCVLNALAAWLMNFQIYGK